MSHIPFGYRIVNGKAVVDDVAAEQIKALFQAYVSGDSLSEAAKKKRALKPLIPLSGGYLKTRVIWEMHFTLRLLMLKHSKPQNQSASGAPKKEYETKNLKSKKRPPFLRPSALRKARRNTATHLCRQNMHTA